MPNLAYGMVTHSGEFTWTSGILEIWSWSWKFSLTSDWGTEAGVAAAASAAYLNHVANIMPSSTVLTRTRVSSHDALTGNIPKNAAGEFNQADDNTRIPGAGVNNPVVPLQTALVVSLNSQRAGARGKGRFFLPWPAFFMADDRRLPSADAINIGTVMKSYFAAVTADATSNVSPVIVSSFGHNSPVTSLAVGRVPDTMRSRRSSLLESKFVTAL